MASSLDESKSFITTSFIEGKHMLDTFKLEIPPKHQLSSSDALTLKDAVRLAKAPTKQEETTFAWSFAFEKKKEPNTCILSNGSSAMRVLQSKINAYPVPRNIGPVVPHYDNHKVNDINCDKVIMEYTAFVHPPQQKCGKWIPVERDPTVFSLTPQYIVEPYDDATEVTDKGPHSNENMSIVYTCSQLKCSVNCSCKVCTSERYKCYKVCGQWPCIQCTSQCPKHHRVGLDRAYNEEEHSYSIKAESIKAVKFMVKHTDIPKDCNDCQDDLMDHQTFHRVFHSRCKFCRQVLAPYDYYDVQTVEDYGTALEEISFRGKLTCAICLKMFMQPSDSKRHKQTVHGGKGSHGCKKCIKKFSNKKDLEYHVHVQHTEPQHESCEQCGKSFISKLSLDIHQQRIHIENRMYDCDKCDSKFTQKNNLLRHRNEKHFARKVDWRLVQLNEDWEFKCALCDKVFQRKSNLNAHKENVHKVSEDGTVVLPIKCAHCGKEYSKKSNVVRHEKSCKDRKK